MNQSVFTPGELIALFVWDIAACLQPGERNGS
jgi:hypothetical protein